METKFKVEDIIAKIRHHQKRIGTESKACYGTDGWISLNKKTIITKSCKYDFPQTWWLTYIEETEANKFLVYEFDIRNLSEKWLHKTLETIDNNGVYSTFNRLLHKASIRHRDIKLRDLILGLDYMGEYALNINISRTPISCREEKEMLIELEDKIKEDLFSYLKSHTPSFKFKSESWKKEHKYNEEESKPYSLTWGKIKGSIFCLPYETFDWSLKYIEADELFSIKGDQLKFTGKYNDKLFSWLRWEFWNMESGCAFESLKEIVNIVNEWKLK